MAVIDSGSNQAGKANVDAAFNLQTALPQVTTPAGVNAPQYVGAARIFSENDPGTITGTARVLSPETSEDFRLRVGVDTMLDQAVFNANIHETSRFGYYSTTLTFAQAGGYLTSNATNITTTTTGALFQSQRNFPLYGNGGNLYIETNAALTGIPGANTVIEFGGFIANTTNPFANVDGVSFRYTSAGLIGVINFNTVETTTSVLSFTPSLNVNYHYTITITESTVLFWIENTLYAVLPIPTGQGRPMLSQNVPWSVRHVHVGGAAASAVNFKVSSYAVSLGDLNTVKPWAEQIAGIQGNALLVQSGTAPGASAITAVTPANAAAVATTVPAAATATATGLGGRTRHALIATATTDVQLFTYTNPAGTALLTGRTLYITGVRISSVVATVLVAPAAGVNALWFGIGYGSSAITLATTESASFTAPVTKIARKASLGYQNFGLVAAAVAGTVGNDIIQEFKTPLVVNPGEIVQIIMRYINCGAGGLIETSVFFDGYFE